MSTPQESPLAGIVTFEPIEAQIQDWRKRFMPMRVDGSQDKQGASLVHDARMEVKAARVAVEKRRKELKADALEYGRRVDDAARAITAKLEPIERHLQEQEDIVLKEQERQKAEAARILAERTDARVRRLAACRADYSMSAIQGMPDDQFESFAASREHQYRESQAAQAAQELAQREERERLAKERAELDAQRRAQQAREEAIRKREEEAAAALAAEEGRKQAQSLPPKVQQPPAKICPTCHQPWPIDF